LERCAGLNELARRRVSHRRSGGLSLGEEAKSYSRLGGLRSSDVDCQARPSRPSPPHGCHPRSSANRKWSTSTSSCPPRGELTAQRSSRPPSAVALAACWIGCGRAPRPKPERTASWCGARAVRAERRVAVLESSTSVAGSMDGCCPARRRSQCSTTSLRPPPAARARRRHRVD